jgi:hypothetical protein
VKKLVKAGLGEFAVQDLLDLLSNDSAEDLDEDTADESCLPTSKPCEPTSPPRMSQRCGEGARENDLESSEVASPTCQISPPRKKLCRAEQSLTRDLAKLADLRAPLRNRILKLRCCLKEEDIHDANWFKSEVEQRVTLQQKNVLEKEELIDLKHKQSLLKDPHYPHLHNELAPLQLLNAMKTGQLKAVDPETKEYRSLASGGLPPTEHADFAIVSTPGADKKAFTKAQMFCAQLGIAFCVVWEDHWGGIWYWVWKQLVKQCVKAKKKLVVLTQHGEAG